MQRSFSILAALGLTVAAATAAADTYTLKTNHTFARFTVTHFGMSSFEGRFDGTDGTLDLDLAKKTGSVDVTIDVNQISTGVEKLNEHLKSKDFFDAAQFPTITFKSTDLKFKADKLVAVVGNLTIHGVTKPVTLTVKDFVCKEHPILKKPACGADAETSIKRSDFGITAYVPAISDEVKISIEAEAYAK